MRQKSPKLQTQRDSKSMQQYLEELDTLLKRNTGSGLYNAEEATSYTPMYIPGRVDNPSGIEENAAAISAYQPRESVIPSLQVPQYEQDAAPQDNQQQNTQNPNIDTGNGNLTVQDFVDKFTQAVYRPQRASTEQLEQIYRQTGKKYGIQSLADGRVRYNDGSIGIEQEVEPVPIASMRDGSILWSDGFTREAPPLNMQQQYAGTPGLSRFIFGRNQTITQPYGNINPIEPTRGNVNYGTDFRTRDLESRDLKLPVDVKVVQTYRDDGTRFGSISGHKGYGNSVLVELPTGERVRLSHLSNLADYKEGDTITAGTVFGTPGATGNTYGEHLDVEYYDKEGKISNPNSFLANATSTYDKSSKIVGVSPYLQRENMSFDPRSIERARQQQETQSQPSQFASYNQPEYSTFSGAGRTSSNAADAVGYNPGQALAQFGQDVKQLPQRAGKVLGQSIDAANLTGELDLGGSEGVFTPEAAAARKDTAIKFAQPAQNRSFLGRFRQSVGNATEQVGDMLGIPETNISEIIAGGKTRQTNQAFAAELDNAARQNEQPGQSLGIKETTENALKQAGQGIKDLGQSGVDALGSVFKPKQEEQKRAVGDVVGTAEGAEGKQFSSVMDGAPSMSSVVKNDISDPFFKMGGSEMYKSFLKPNAKDLFGGALSMDIFTPDFYKDLSNITSVFGGSKDIGAATERYVQEEKKKYPSMARMNWEEGYDRGEVDNYNRQVDEYNNSINNYLNSIRSSVVGVKSVFTPVVSSKQNIFAKPQAAMSMSQSTAPRMSAAPSIVKPQMSVARPSAAPQMSSVSRVSAPSSSGMSAPSRISASPSAAPSARLATPAKASAPAPSAPKSSAAYTVRTIAPVKLAPAPAIAKMATPSKPAAPSASIKPAAQKAPAPQSKQSSNVFTRVTNAIKNVFRR